MKNTNTHILIEPYENEVILKKENITIDSFINESNNLLESIRNSDYSDIDKFTNLDSETVSDILNVDIPNKFTDVSLGIIYQFSNKDSINNLINDLNSKINCIFELKTDSTIKEIEEKINTIKLFILDIGTENYENIKEFSDITSFDNILSIVDSSFYNSLIEWISIFPSRLLDMRIDMIGTTQKEDTLHNHLSNKINVTKTHDTIEMNSVKQELIYNIYLLYRTLVNNIIQTKLFWNKFLDMYESDNNVLDFDEFDNSNMNLILSELDEDTENETEYTYGNEDDPMKGGGVFHKNSVGDSFKTIGKFFKALPSKVNKIRKQFKLYRMRSKNRSFYMKYMGRIEGLYERYSDEAQMIENGMKDDPVKVLKEDGREYIINVSNEFVTLQNQLIDLSKKFASTSNPKEIFEMLKKFGGMYSTDINKSSEIVSHFMKSIRFKVAEIILKNNKIYGYTAQSIAENEKLPPSNHAIVTLFVDRPDEKPFDQKVSDIFKSVDSFKMIAENEKEPIFELTMVCSDTLTKGIQEDSYKLLKENKKTSKEKMKLAIKDISANEENPKKAAKQYEQQWAQSWKAIEKAYGYMLKIKNYVADLIQSYFIMMTRIDNLCKECLVSMLKTETMHKDTRYNTGHKATNLKAHKEYQQDEEAEANVQTAGEKQLEKEERYKAKKEEMRNRAESIRHAMAVNRFF